MPRVRYRVQSDDFTDTRNNSDEERTDNNRTKYLVIDLRKRRKHSVRVFKGIKIKRLFHFSEFYTLPDIEATLEFFQTMPNTFAKSTRDRLIGHRER